MAVRHGHCIAYASSPFEAAQLMKLLPQHRNGCHGQGDNKKTRNVLTQTGTEPLSRQGPNKGLRLALLLRLLLAFSALALLRVHIESPPGSVCICDHGTSKG